MWYGLGVFIPVLVLLHYNYICYENPFASGYKYELTYYFRENMAKGFMGITYPTWEGIWGITFSKYRGLFYYSPVLLAALPGFYYLCKTKTNRVLGWLVVFIVVSFFLFNSSYYAWWGGWACGPRHSIPMLPFMAIAVYALLPRFRKIVYILGSLSVLMMSLVTVTDPQFPQKYLYPLRDYTIPLFIHGELTQNILTLFGVARTVAVAIWFIYLIIGFVFLLKLVSSPESSPAPSDTEPA